MLRGSEVLRLMTMLVMLATLGGLVFGIRGRGPKTPPAPERTADETAAAQAADPIPAAPTVPPNPAAAPAAEASSEGPTDEDPEQQADAADEFLAVADGTVGLQPEDMLAYWRLFYWVEHQGFADLQRRASGQVALSDLMQFPDQYRGRLIRLDLNVRRVLAYDVEDSPVGVHRVYEIWGWSDESKAWLYALVTAHLPEGMTVGAEVCERARFVGYFLKLHGYYEAGAAPRAKPLRAPLLVGRLVRHPAVSPRVATNYDWLSVIAVTGLAIVLGGAAVGQWLFHRRAARQRAARQEQASAGVREWLQTGFAASAADEEHSPTRAPNELPQTTTAAKQEL